MAVPNEHTFPHLATLGDCSIKTALRWLKTKHWIGKYIGMHPGMSLALATFTNHSPKLPYLSNCITLVKIFFWKHRVNFVHYVLLPTEQAETYLKIYYLTQILRQGGRTWQAFGGGKNGHETFRQARIYNFHDKCVVFARSCKLAK